MSDSKPKAIGAVLSLLALASVCGAAEQSEFKAKRQELYEFSEKPALKRDGDRVEITFTSKGYCDVTVSIESNAGVIMRHLASGVLGAKAPEPFQKNSLRQCLVWDGKNDAGEYLDRLEDLVVRVALGLKPQFERTLFWSPYKRIGRNPPVFAPAEEGMYVCEGHGVDSLRLYNHEGQYLRTIYPFPGDKLAAVKGLDMQEFPQDGQRLPVKIGPKHRSTLLTCGDNTWGGSPAKHGCAATAIAAVGGRIALVSAKLNRLSADGTTGGLNLEGAETGLPWKVQEQPSQPRSTCLSPDGKWVYLTNYHYFAQRPEDYLHCVMRMEYAGTGKMELFAGSSKIGDHGATNEKLCCPTSVACDEKGRVFVADYMNDRIQIFSADGKFLQSVKVTKPAHLSVNPKTAEMYVGSWMLDNRFIPSQQTRVEAMLYTLGPPEEPKLRGSCPLALTDYAGTMSETMGLEYRMSVDFCTQPPTIWLLPGKSYQVGGWGVISDRGDLRGTGISLLVVKDGKLQLKRDFHSETTKEVVRATPPKYVRQRMYVNPKNGKLYVAEGDSGVGKSFKQLVEIDPSTGAVKLLPLPFPTEDLAIDLSGRFHLRTDFAVGRYDSSDWREIPYDYGEEMEKVSFDLSAGGANLICGLPLPGTGRMGWYHLGGMAISPRGDLAVTCCNTEKASNLKMGDENFYSKGASIKQGPVKYRPRMYPGRAMGWETHIWDKHGKMVQEDALKGLVVTDGLGLDKDRNVYVMASAQRFVDGSPYFLPWTETLLKANPVQFRAVSSGEGLPVSLAKEAWPKRSPEMNIAGGGPAWVEGAEWLYGGVGFNGFSAGGGVCICWNARFCLDFFARSFVPEVDHFSVAVLDTSGNLILRIGKYGNVDEGKPLQLAGGPANPRSIGGDEVVLYHAPYVATHTDHHLFISDGGNSRILSVQLGYHAEERTALKDLGNGK